MNLGTYLRLGAIYRHNYMSRKSQRILLSELSEEEDIETPVDGSEAAKEKNKAKSYELETNKDLIKLMNDRALMKGKCRTLGVRGLSNIFRTTS